MTERRPRTPSEWYESMQAVHILHTKESNVLVVALSSSNNFFFFFPINGNKRKCDWLWWDSGASTCTPPSEILVLFISFVCVPYWWKLSFIRLLIFLSGFMCVDDRQQEIDPENRRRPRIQLRQQDRRVFQSAPRAGLSAGSLWRQRSGIDVVVLA